MADFMDTSADDDVTTSYDPSEHEADSSSSSSSSSTSIIVVKKNEKKKNTTKKNEKSSKKRKHIDEPDGENLPENKKRKRASSVKGKKEPKIPKMKAPANPKNTLHISYSGIFNGCIIIGILKSNKNVQMQLIFDDQDHDTLKWYSPAYYAAEELGNRPQLMKKLLDTVQFSHMGKEEALSFIKNGTPENIKTAGRRHFNQFPNLRVRFLDLGKYDGKTNGSILADPEEIDDDLKNWLLSEEHLYADVVERIPLLTKEGGSLFSDYEQWELFDGDHSILLEDINTKIINTLTGKIEDPRKGEMVYSKSISDKEKIYLWIPKDNEIPKPIRHNTLELVKHIWKLQFPEEKEEELTNVNSRSFSNLVSIGVNFSASELKSLIQKIIRFQPLNVLIPNNASLPFTSKFQDTIAIPSKYVLVMAMISLASKPGYFLPDLGVYVTGVHSLAKRLFVILLEDASGAENDDDLFSLISCALLSSNNTQWFPTSTQLLKWIKIAIYGLESSYFYDYSIATGDSILKIPLKISSGKPKEMMSAMLDYIGSFSGDCSMTRHIMKNNLTPVKGKAKYRPKEMPLWHYCDQHVSGNLVYFMNHDSWSFKNNIKCSSNQYFKNIFEAIFGITGFNPRRKSLEAMNKMINSQIYNNLRIAQESYFFFAHFSPLQQQQQHHQVAWNDKFEYKKMLDDRWLGALLGDREFKENKKATPYYATLDINNILNSEFKATRKPSRDGSDTVDENSRQNAITEFGNLLHKGVVMNACDAPHPSLEGCTLSLSKREFKIGKRLWNDVKNVTTFVPFIAKEPKSLDEIWDLETDNSSSNSSSSMVISSPLAPLSPIPPPPPYKIPIVINSLFKNHERKMYKNSDDLFKMVLISSPRNLRVRLLQWLLYARGHNFKIPNITRSVNQASATTTESSLDRPISIDPTVFQKLFLPMLILYPSVMQFCDHEIIKFKIKDAIFLDHIRDVISKYIDYHHEEEQKMELSGVLGGGGGGGEMLHVWKGIGDRSKSRENLDFQQTAIRLLTERFVDQKMMGQLLWMDPGSGKTFIVLSFLKNLIDKGLLPRYVIYIAPRSAFATVQKELKEFGFDVIIGKKNGNSTSDSGSFIEKVEVNTVLLLEHDWLRQEKLLSILEPVIPDSFILIDEMHKMLNPTLRTSYGQSLAASCRGFVAFTGTPIINNDPMKLAPWLTLVLPYHVTVKNIWTSLGVFLTIPSTKKIPVIEEQIEFDQNPKDILFTEYTKQRRTFEKDNGHRAFRPLLNSALQLAYQKMVEKCLECLNMDTYSDITLLGTGGPLTPKFPRKKMRVMMVVYNQEDQETLKNNLIKESKGSLKASDILLFGKFTKRPKFDVDERDYNAGYGIVDFTDKTVEENHGRNDYKVIIVPQQRDTGYSLSRCEYMITSVYPSNEATRTQLRNRINRIDQKAKKVHIVTITGGILTTLYENYKEAQSVASALRVLTEKSL